MENGEKLMFIVGVSLIIAANILPSLGQEEYTGMKMNASISQPICIQLSDELADGIFFTNTTTIGVQYPITDMTTWNNATYNYNTTGGPYGTLYYVAACSGTTGVYKIYQSVCEDLLNTTVNGRIEIDYVDRGQGEGYEGIGAANDTTATGVPNLPQFGPSAPDTYFLIGYNISDTYSGRETLYLRYWLNPYPNNIPSGIYNTTFKIKAVDYAAPEPTDATC